MILCNQLIRNVFNYESINLKNSICHKELYVEVQGVKNENNICEGIQNQMAAPIAPYGIPPMMNQVDFQFQNLQMRQQVPSQYHHMQQNNNHMINMHRQQMPQVPQRQQPERQGLYHFT